MVRATPAAKALGAALLFGAGAPAAKALVGRLDLHVLAALLYLGSGVALLLGAAVRRGIARPGRRLAARELPWLAAAIACGGVAAPLCLLWGLARTPASSASLVLALEAPLTAALAAVFFREPLGARLLVAIGLVAVGSALVGGSGLGGGEPVGLAAVAGACLLWALDNNLTREVAEADAVAIAAAKGWTAGAINLVLAWALGERLGESRLVLAALAIGGLSYGASLVLFVLALRDLGAARTSAYFGTAPFLGAALAVLLLGEPVAPLLLVAALLVAAGTWVLAGEVHSHLHHHAAFEHSHPHSHDEHHRHGHDGAAPVGPHEHSHRHDELVHEHDHTPDSHHHHSHR